MNKPQSTATIVPFPAHRVVRRNGVPVQPMTAAPGAPGASRANPRTDIDFGSWYHFAAIKDQDRSDH